MNYLIALFGVLAYNIVLWRIAKDKCDKLEKDFPYKLYFKYNVDNWMTVFVFMFPVVWYVHDVAMILNKLLLDQTGFSLSEEVYYLSAGPLSELVVFGIMWAIGRKEAFIAPVHKD